MENIHSNSKQPFYFIDEIWKPITSDNVNYIIEGYQISNYGRIYNSNKNLFLNRFIDKDGYYRINLAIKLPENSYKISYIQKGISRLVKQAFDPIPNPDQYEVHHIDLNRINNYIGNLAWVTPEEHQKITKATWPKGKEAKLYGPNGSNTKLTKEQVLEIKDRIMRGDYRSLRQLSFEYGVGETCVWYIAHDVNWTNFGNFSINSEDLRVSSGFTNQEINDICKYFESHDINNRVLYPTKQKLITECYYDLKLNEKYGDNLETKRKLLTHILLKNHKYVNKIASRYSYEYIDKKRRPRQ